MTGLSASPLTPSLETPIIYAPRVAVHQQMHLSFTFTLATEEMADEPPSKRKKERKSQLKFGKSGNLVKNELWGFGFMIS